MKAILAVALLLAGCGMTDYSALEQRVQILEDYRQEQTMFGAPVAVFTCRPRKTCARLEFSVNGGDWITAGVYELPQFPAPAYARVIVGGP